MAKPNGNDHAQINYDVWGDDDFRELPVDAQNLYWTLWTSPGRSYCGAHDWHPGKLTQRAGDWSVPRIESAGAVLSERLFLIIDCTTEECLLRSWIKHDGLWKIPNMAVSMANARADLASKVLRGVVVHEVKKLVAANPDLSSWERDAVAKMLGQNPVDPATLEPFAAGPNPLANPPRNPYGNPSYNRKSDIAANPPRNPGPTPAPTPLHISNSSSMGGYETGERHQAAPPDPNNPPPRHCPLHMPDGTTEPCHGCGHANNEFEAWQKACSEAQHRARREELQHEAVIRAMAIVNCDLCDDDGYRNGVVCDHIDRADTNAAGMAKVRAAIGARKTNADTLEPDIDQPQEHHQ